MFDESLNPQPYVDLQAPEYFAPYSKVVAHKHDVSTGSPSSTTVDQDAPSPSNSPTTQETQTPIISHDVEEDNHDIEVAHMGNDPYFGIPIPEVSSDPSSSSDVIHTIVPPDHQVSEHNSKWTKDHPLENIIVEPKNYKDALTQACWIEAMQEELHEFERGEVQNWMRIKKDNAVDPSYYLDFFLCTNSICSADHLVVKIHSIAHLYQLDNIFTKALGRERIEFLINKLGMRSFTPETLKNLADDVDE
ncbi:hypothetical protein Tco_0537638 [Tanacetum coccineum]